MIKEYEKTRRNGPEKKDEQALIEKGLLNRKKAINIYILNNLPIKPDSWGL